MITETPKLGEVWCPTCLPGRDPTLEILDVRYCDAHTPDREGAADGLVRYESTVSGSAEAGGEPNRIWCQFLHRGRV